VIIRSACVVALVLVFAGPASAVEVTIVPNVSIGKVKLGMTFGQVKKVMGPPQVVNARKQLSRGRGFIEYGWDFSTLWVGFVNTKGVLRAVLIGTGLVGEKTKEGIGVGVSLEKLRASYRVTCVNTSEAPFDPRIYTDPGDRLVGYCVVGSLSAPTTVFGVGCKTRVPVTDKCADWRVNRVIVRRATL
jgi:hypothetical protein